MLESQNPLRTQPLQLGEQLVCDGVVTATQLAEALARQGLNKKRLGETLLQLGYITPARLGTYLERATNCAYVDLDDFSIDPAVAQRINESRARRLHALPIQERGSEVLVAMADPLNLGAIDELSGLLNRRITPLLAFENDLGNAINRVFNVHRKAQGIIAEIGADERPQWEAEPTLDELITSAEDAPVVKLVTSLIAGAIASDASDIHIEPQENTVRVRYRIDGLLYDQMHIPANFRAAVISRIKIMARCDIAERRRPQDGRILYKQGQREHDLRVSVMPTVYGEKVAVRLLERDIRLANLEQMGLFPEQYHALESVIRRPHGMVLVTGPTGSGKSTTLQAVLTRINSPTVNISTVEDPVEYMVPGVNHTQVDPRIGVTFASGLRTLVRQDPDIIMVGEIRDRETAEIAIQAAMTGHLVFSTLHTNDAPSAITRLINMGIEPFMIGSALLCVVGQRLVRTLCPACRQETPATPDLLRLLGQSVQMDVPQTLWHGAGCARCGGRGMKGRTGVFEIMPMTDWMRSLTQERAPSATLYAAAVQQGMQTMRDAAVKRVLQGITTVEEVARVLVMEADAAEIA